MGWHLTTRGGEYSVFYWGYEYLISRERPEWIKACILQRVEGGEDEEGTY